MSLAKYQPYTIDQTPLAAYPEGAPPKLTDNRVAYGDLNAYAWVGFDSPVTVIIPLTQSALIKRCRVLLGRFSGSNIEAPASIDFAVGDSSSYQAFGTISPAVADNAATYVFTDDSAGITGDHLRVILTPKTGKTMLIAEIQAWDTDQPMLFDLPEDYFKDLSPNKVMPALPLPKPLKQFYLAGLLQTPLGAFNGGTTVIRRSPKLKRTRPMHVMMASSLVTVQSGGATVTGYTADLTGGRLTVNAQLSQAAGLIVAVTDLDGRALAYTEDLTAKPNHSFTLAVPAYLHRVELHLEVSGG